MDIITLLTKEKTLIYTFDGLFNFFLDSCHLNNVMIRQENIILLNLERIHYRDADFLAEYYEIIKRFEKAGKTVYVIGLKKKYFQE